MKLSHLLLTLITIALLASIASAQYLPPRLDINLDRSIMWHTLPPEVTAITQGPDGRVWLTLRPDKPLTRETFRAILSREYHEKMPQIPAARPILFEPSGRVWLTVDPLLDDQGVYTQRILLAYDGTTTDERPINPNFSHSQISTAFADGQGGAFFCTPETIHIYDGKQWLSREVPARSNPNELPYRLIAETSSSSTSNRNAGLGGACPRYLELFSNY